MKRANPPGGFKKIVVKLGSALLVGDELTPIDLNLIHSVAAQITSLRKKGTSVVLVSSGAIALGSSALGLERPPQRMADRQALAAIGQSILMTTWRNAFAVHGVEVAQVLLTHDDIQTRQRYLNASQTLDSLLQFDVLPIVNENDTVSTEEIRLGDNDRLSALVASIIQADGLFILSTAEALFDRDPTVYPDAVRIPVVEKVTQDMIDRTESSRTNWGTGGMVTKLDAARAATSQGIPTYLAQGRIKHILSRLVEGEPLGTMFCAGSRELQGRKHWIGYSLVPMGSMVVDQGAQTALCQMGKSLLPSGVLSVEGTFRRGDCVRVLDVNGTEICRGITNFDAHDINRIKGHSSNDIHDLIGFHPCDEVIHRDDLVLKKDR